jgi:hypothetical protein
MHRRNLQDHVNKSTNKNKAGDTVRFRGLASAGPSGSCGREATPVRSGTATSAHSAGISPWDLVWRLMATVVASSISSLRRCLVATDMSAS